MATSSKHSVTASEEHTTGNTNPPPRLSPDGTELSLMGMPPEIRREILRQLLRIEHNETFEITKPKHSELGWRAHGRDDFNAAFSGIVTRCRFAGVAILATCKEFWMEGLEVLYVENYFVAVVGRHKVVEHNLKRMGFEAFWSSPTWQKHWAGTLGDQLLLDIPQWGRYQPDFAITCKGITTGEVPILLPAKYLELAILALTRNPTGDPEPHSVSEAYTNLTPQGLSIGLAFRRNRLWFGDGREATTEEIRKQFCLWGGKLVSKIVWMPLTVENHAPQQLVAEAIAKACRPAGRQHPAFEDIAVYRRLKELVLDIENDMDDGQSGKALTGFQHLAHLVDHRLSIIPLGAPPRHRNKVIRLYSYAAYRISHLKDPQTFGWDKQDFTMWAFERTYYAGLAFSELGDAWLARALLRSGEILIHAYQDSSHRVSYFRVFDQVASVLAPDELDFTQKLQWGSDFVETRNNHLSITLKLVLDGLCLMVLSAASLFGVFKVKKLGRWERGFFQREIDFFRAELVKKYGPEPTLKTVEAVDIL